MTSPSIRPSLTVGWVNEDFPVIFRRTPESNALTGIYVEMWKTWAAVEGFQLKYIQGDGYGGWDAGPKGWDGVLGLIWNGSCNATLDKYTLRTGRFHAFRASHPVIYSKDTFFDARYYGDGYMSINFVVYDSLLLSLFIASFVLVLLVERVLFLIRKEWTGQRRRATTLSKSLLYVVQDYFFLKPSVFSFFSPQQISLFSFVAYTASLMFIILTYQAVFKGNSNVITFKKTTMTAFVDALRAGTKALVVASPSLIYDEQMYELYGQNVRNDSFRLQIQPDYDKMAVTVCTDERVLAYVPDYRLSTVDPSKPFRPPCDFVEVDASVSPPGLKTADAIKEEQPFVFYFNKKYFNRRYAEMFNLILLMFYDYDTMFTFQWKKWTNRPMKKTTAYVEVGSMPVSFPRLSIVFIALLLGLLLACIVLLTEMIYACFREQRIFAVNKLMSPKQSTWSLSYRTQTFDGTHRRKSAVEIILLESKRNKMSRETHDECNIQ